MTMRPKTTRRAFTLIELMIVVGIIVILSALLVGGVNQALKHARIQQCRVMLQALKAAADEYEISVGGAKIPHFDGFGTPPEYLRNSSAPSSNSLDETIERFVWFAMQNRDTEKMIRSIGSNFVKDYDGNGFLEVNDPFGTRTEQFKIVYVAKVSHNDLFGADDRLPEYHRPYFVSGGPDGEIGDINGTGDQLQFTEDNMYSFEIDDTASGSQRN